MSATQKEKSNKRKERAKMKKKKKAGNLSLFFFVFRCFVVSHGSLPLVQPWGSLLANRARVCRRHLRRAKWWGLLS